MSKFFVLCFLHVSCHFKQFSKKKFFWGVGAPLAPSEKMSKFFVLCFLHVSCNFEQLSKKKIFLGGGAPLAPLGKNVNMGSFCVFYMFHAILSNFQNFPM